MAGSACQAREASRAVGPERPLARLRREVGVTFRMNALLRDMNLCVPTFDARAIGVLAGGLPPHHGAQLEADTFTQERLAGMWWCPTTCVSHERWCPHCCPARERTQIPRTSGQREVPVRGARHGGDRWSKEAADFIKSLAEAEARDAPPLLGGSAFFGWRRRWTRFSAVSCGVIRGAFSSNNLAFQARAKVAEERVNGPEDLFCDGASTDKIFSRLQRFADRVVVWKNRPAS